MVTLRWLVPAMLFAAWPFVHFANQNRLEPFDPVRLAADAAVYAAAVSCLVFIVGAAFPNRRFAQVAGVASVGTVALFAYGPIEAAWLGYGVSAPRYPLGTWFLLAAVVLLLAWRLSRHASVLPVLTAAAVVMNAIPAAQLAFWHWGRPAPEPVVALESHARVSVGHRPNVYFFILDMYGRHDQLQRVLGFDNTPFLRELQAHGFFVAGESLANYGVTELSVPATLAMEYLVEPGDTVLKDRFFTHLTRGHNAVVRRFRDLGYAYAHAHSSGRHGSACAGAEDYCLNRSGLGGLAETEIHLLAQTPVLAVAKGLEQRGYIGRVFRHHLVGVTDVLDALPEAMRQPFFLFSHIMAPHSPYRYHADCAPRFLTAAGMSLRADRQGHDVEKLLYLDNLKCINKQLVAATERILAKDPGAIVIFQGDHGTAFTVDYGRSLAEWSEAQFHERYGILNAVRFPPQCRQTLYPSFSPVNTFRLVFSCLEGRAAELLPDRAILVGYNQHEALEKL